MIINHIVLVMRRVTEKANQDGACLLSFNRDRGRLLFLLVMNSVAQRLLVISYHAIDNPHVPDLAFETQFFHCFITENMFACPDKLQSETRSG
jgi:hypothetical protein